MDILYTTSIRHLEEWRGEAGWLGDPWNDAVVRVLGIVFFFVSCTLDLEQEKQASWKCPWEQTATKIVQKSALSSSRRSQESSGLTGTPTPTHTSKDHPTPGREAPLCTAPVLGKDPSPGSREPPCPPHWVPAETLWSGNSQEPSPPWCWGRWSREPQLQCLPPSGYNENKLGGDGAPPSFQSRVRREPGSIHWPRACSAANRGLNQVQSHNIIQRSPGFSSNSLVRPSIGRISNGMRKTVTSGQRC